jgi:hypothetical protein
MDPPPKSFEDTLKRWKLSKDLGGVQANALVLKNSYRCQEITNMSTLREILDLKKNVDFLQQGATRTIVVCTTNNYEKLIIWMGKCVWCT